MTILQMNGLSDLQELAPSEELKKFNPEDLMPELRELRELLMEAQEVQEKLSPSQRLAHQKLYERLFYGESK